MGKYGRTKKCESLRKREETRKCWSSFCLHLRGERVKYGPSGGEDPRVLTVLNEDWFCDCDMLSSLIGE
ncbi:hypothetical protein GN956_G21553 [Arapaima gigas]